MGGPFSFGYKGTIAHVVPKGSTTIGLAGDIALITVAALVGGLLAHKLGLPSLLGYIVAGVAVGPHTGGPTVVEVHDIELLADIGVALLLFAVGLEFPINRLAPVKGIALVGTPLQMLLTAAFGMGLGHALGWDWRSGLWFGCLITVSSTMVVLKYLADNGLMETLSARVMTAVLIVQDLAIIPMIILLPSLGDGASSGMSALGVALVRATAFVAAMLLFGRKVLPWLMSVVAGWRSRELFMITVVALGLGVGYLTWLIGLSFAFGAFLAGVVLTESDYSHQALSEVIPLRDLFSMIFFVSVGMLINPWFLREQLGTIVALVVSVLLCKALIFAGITRAFGYANIMPLAVGLGLSQVGEFAFVLARLGKSSGALPEGIYLTVLTVAALTMSLTPFLARLAAPIYRWWRRRTGSESIQTIDLPAQGLRGHVILAGYGRVGRFLARLLLRLGYQVLLIEQNPERLPRGTEGLHLIGGDVSSEVILDAAGVHHARMVLLTIPDAVASLQALEKVRQLNPRIPVMARAVSLQHLEDLFREGAYEAVLPELEGGLEMLHGALIRLGHPEDAVQDYVDEVRHQHYQPLATGEVDTTGMEPLLLSAKPLGVSWQALPPGSPLVGRSLQEAAAGGGLRIVAVLRGGEMVGDPADDYPLQAGDILGVAGSPEERRAFGARARKTESP